MLRKLYIYIFVVLSMVLSARADSPRGSEILHAIDQRFDSLNYMIFHTHPHINPYYGHTSVFLSREELSVSTDDYDRAVKRRVDADISHFKAATGVQITGQAYWRLDNVLTDYDDDDQVSVYDGKLQIEARWYVLQSSLFKRKGNIAALKLKGEIDRVQHQSEVRDLNLYYQKELFRQVNDSLLSGILQQRLRNLNLLSEAQMYLLENENMNSAQLLSILDDKAEAERLLATLRPGIQPSHNLSGIDAYTVELDSAALMKQIGNNDAGIRLLELRLKLLEQQEKNTSYWTDCRLAPFLRYSYYMRTYQGNTGNVDLGVSFTVPINFQAKKERKVLQAQQKVLQAQRVDILRQASDKIRYYAVEIERINRACIGEIHRLEELKRYLQIRNNAYENRMGQYDRLNRLMEFNSYLVSIERLITLQYQRDCYIADLQMLLPAGSILQYCTETKIL